MDPTDTPPTDKMPVHPLAATASDDKNAAADVIRHKIASLYLGEPDAKEELEEAKEAPKPHSKHQEYMLNLSSSGKSLAEIQTAWHEYYTSLPDNEKHEVWQEFYAQAGQTSHYMQSAARAHQAAHAEPRPQPEAPKPIVQASATQSVSELKHQMFGRIDDKKMQKAKQHLKSLGFGLMMGSLSLIILLFGFFNERFLAPFITPSKAVSSTPIIIDPNSVSTSADPRIIIPKINVELPVVYDEPTIDEKKVDKALERGVVHYASTANPGEKGNAAIFGHSSNNILNPGKFKFAFVLLSRLEKGDTFVLTKDSKRYVYQVYDKKIVKPEQVDVLDTQEKAATATLITCDPPGTSLNRLIVIGEQISPDPAGNTASTATKAPEKPVILPSNSTSLWQRIWTSLSR